MDEKKFFLWSTLLSGAGVLFAGYLTTARLVTGICPFNEPCPYFLGYPACWYGLAMFVMMFLLSLLGWCGSKATRSKIQGIRLISGVGIFFAGSFVVREIILAIEYGLPNYALLLPTCAYGLIVYGIVFVLSHQRLKQAASGASSAAM